MAAYGDWTAAAAAQPVVGIADDGTLEPLMGELPCPADALSLRTLTAALGMAKPLVIAGKRFRSFRIAGLLDEAGIPFVQFDGFSPNPKWEEVDAALAAFDENGCDSFISVGGGSAMDVAKCTVQRLLDREVEDDAETPPVPRQHIAVPTTAGSGAEATHFAVVYRDGKKQSITDRALLPSAVLLDPQALTGLPEYQKKSTLLDALCQAIESYWSVNSCEASRGYSAEAIPLIMANANAYLGGDPAAAKAIQRAAHLAGKAINLTTTTAAHAMSYKLTSLYGTAHGHAVALSMPHVWRLLIERGDETAQARFADIAALMTGNVDAAAEEGLRRFAELVTSFGIVEPLPAADGDVAVLTESVNPERLANFPIVMSAEDIAAIYRLVLAGK